jgi:hypothetical protein
MDGESSRQGRQGGGGDDGAGEGRGGGGGPQAGVGGAEAGKPGQSRGLASSSRPNLAGNKKAAKSGRFLDLEVHEPRGRENFRPGRRTFEPVLVPGGETSRGAFRAAGIALSPVSGASYTESFVKS